jgi:hypothetical protein
VNAGDRLRKAWEEYPFEVISAGFVMGRSSGKKAVAKAVLQAFEKIWEEGRSHERIPGAVSYRKR